MKTIDAVGWVHVRDRRLLCARTRNKDAFYLPGGKREVGESDWEALAREVREEISVAIDVKTFAFFGKFDAAAHGHGPGAMVTMVCYESGYRGTIAPSNEIEELAWMTYGERHRCAPASQLVMKKLFEAKRIDL